MRASRAAPDAIEMTRSVVAGSAALPASAPGVRRDHVAMTIEPDAGVDALHRLALGEFPPAALDGVMRKLDPRQVAQLATVNKAFAQAAGSPHIWTKAAEAFGVNQLLTPWDRRNIRAPLPPTPKVRAERLATQVRVGTVGCAAALLSAGNRLMYGDNLTQLGGMFAFMGAAAVAVVGYICSHQLGIRRLAPLPAPLAPEEERAQLAALAILGPDAARAFSAHERAHEGGAGIAVADAAFQAHIVRQTANAQLSQSHFLATALRQAVLRKDSVALTKLAPYVASLDTLLTEVSEMQRAAAMHRCLDDKAWPAVALLGVAGDFDVVDHNHVSGAHKLQRALRTALTCDPFELNEVESILRCNPDVACEGADPSAWAHVATALFAAGGPALSDVPSATRVQFDRVLHAAIDASEWETVRSLTRNQALHALLALDAAGTSGATKLQEAYFAALRAERYEEAKKLLDCGAVADYPDATGGQRLRGLLKNRLFASLAAADYAAAVTLVDAGARLAWQNSPGLTARAMLHDALRGAIAQADLDTAESILGAVGPRDLVPAPPWHVIYSADALGRARLGSALRLVQADALRDGDWETLAQLRDAGMQLSNSQQLSVQIAWKTAVMAGLWNDAEGAARCGARRSEGDSESALALHCALILALSVGDAALASRLRNLGARQSSFLAALNL